jgi:hypothetical protein
MTRDDGIPILVDAERRDVVGRLEAPPAPRDLIGRVVAERAKGARVVLPGGEGAASPPVVRSGVVAAAVVLLVIGLATLQRWPAGRAAPADSSSSGECTMASDLARLLSGSALFLSVACGQEPAGRILEPVPATAPLDGGSLSEGNWVFGNAGADGEVHGTQVYRLKRWNGEEGDGWLVVASWHDDRRTTTDSLHLAADGARPVRRVLRRTLDGREIRHITMTHRADSVDVVTDFPGYPAYGYRWANVLPREVTPVVSVSMGPGYGFVHIVRLLPLGAGWTGSVYVAPLPSGRYTPTILRAVGDERVSVPAGTFDCWRVTVEHDDHVWLTLWVGKRPRQLVKAAFAPDPQGRTLPFETVLISSETSGQ